MNFCGGRRDELRGWRASAVACALGLTALASAGEAPGQPPPAQPAAQAATPPAQAATPPAQATTPPAQATTPPAAENAERPKIRYWLDDAPAPAAENGPRTASTTEGEGYPSPRDPVNDALIIPPPPPTLKDISAEVAETSARRAALLKMVAVQLKAIKAAYRQQDYQHVASIARNILTADPANTAAAEWLRIARNALIDADERVADITAERRDRETLLEAEEGMVRPPPRLPTERPHLLNRNEDQSLAKRKKIMEQLEQKVTVDFTKADLDFVLNTLFILTGVNIIADQAALTDKEVTLHVQDLPLREVLNFIVRNNDGIQYSVTDDAVWVTASEGDDQKKMMYPKVYPLHYGLVSTTPNQGGGNRGGGTARAGNNPPAGGGGGGGGAAGGGAGGQQEPTYLETVLKWMKDAKDPHTFPEGSDYFIDRQSNNIIVFTTPAGHAEFAKFLDIFDQPALQCLIKARFLRIEAENDSSLGTNLNSLTYNNSSTPTAATTAAAAAAGTASTGNSRIQTALALLAGGANLTSAPSAATTGGLTTLSLVGSRTNPTFNLGLNMLLADTRTKILSEPQILAVNNKEAVIDVTTNFSYITSLEPIQTVQSATTTSAVASTAVSGYVPQFDEEKIGFTLIVTPSIGRDLKTITLHLSPVIDSLAQGQTISQFQSFPVGTVNNNNNVTPPTIQRPTIDQTSLETDVVIEDNGYCIIGGLVRNNVNVSENKIPILWKIPVVGKFLFQNTSTTISKDNLIMIVEAQILSPSGRTYFREPEPDDANAREGGVNHAPGETSDAAQPAHNTPPNSFGSGPEAQFAASKPMPGWVPPERGHTATAADGTGDGTRAGAANNGTRAADSRAARATPPVHAPPDWAVAEEEPMPDDAPARQERLREPGQ